MKISIKSLNYLMDILFLLLDNYKFYAIISIIKYLAEKGNSKYLTFLESQWMVEIDKVKY